MRSYTWAYATLEMLWVLGLLNCNSSSTSTSFLFEHEYSKIKKNKTAKCGKCNALQLEAARHRTNRSRSLLFTRPITEVCWTNSAVRHSLDFAFDKVLFKISVALSKDFYRDICNYFGTDLDSRLTYPRPRLVKTGALSLITIKLFLILDTKLDRITRGLLNSQQINRINAFFRKACRFGLCIPTCLCDVSEYLRLVDSRLFNRIHIPSHCLSHLLPPEKHHLGPRGHSYTLPICPNNLCKFSFIPRCLFCSLIINGVFYYCIYYNICGGHLF